MSTPQISALDVQLAKFGGVSLKSSSQLTAYVTLLGTFLTGTFGHDWGISHNAQTISFAGFALIAAVHLLSRSIHHVAVERHNGFVKVALIGQASAAQIPVVADSPMQAVTSVPASAGSTVATDASWAPADTSSL